MSAGRLSLPGLARRRLAHQRGLAAALTLGLTAAVGLATTVPLLQAEAAEAGLGSALAARADTAGITVEQFNTRDPPAFETFQRDASRRVETALGPHLVAGARYGSLGAAVPVALNGAPIRAEPDDPRPTLAYYRDLGAHVEVTGGKELPADSATTSGDYAAAVSESGANALGIKLGDRYCITLAVGFTRNASCMLVAAVWRPRDPGEPYWGQVPRSALVMLSLDDLYAAQRAGPGRSVVAGQIYAPRLGTIDPRSAAGVARRVNQLRGYFAIQREGLFATTLDATINHFFERQRVAAFTTQLVAAALVLVALYAAGFVAGHFLEAQARELSVLRARGWRRRRAWTLLVTQLGALALIALPVGVGAGVAATFAISLAAFGGGASRPGLGDLASTVPTLPATLAVGAALLAAQAAAAARRDALDVRPSASRPAPAPWWRWRNLDLALVLLAAPLLLESRLQGSGQLRALAGDDPLSVLFPALALAFLAIGCLRLLPLAARPASWGGVAARLAGWQLARRPAQHASVALLLTFAVALSTFSALYAATERANTIDRAAYRAGADLRVTYVTTQRPLGLDSVVAGLPGVTRATTAFRASATPGASSASATVLGIDAGSFPSTAWSRPDLNGVPIPRLVSHLARSDTDGLSLPDGSGALSARVYSTGLDTRLVASVTDAEGHDGTCDLGSLAYAGWRLLRAPLRFAGPGAPAGPVRLRSLTVRQAEGGRTDGQVALSDLAAGVAGGDAVVEPFDRQDGWWMEVAGISGLMGDLVPSKRVVRDDGLATVSLEAHLVLGDLVLRPAPSAKPVPALVSAGTLESLGIGMGQPFPIHVDALGVQVVAVGVVDYFPTLYPGQEQFLIVPRDSLLPRLARAGYVSAWANEVWLDLRGQAGPVTDRLRAVAQVLDLADRSEIQSAALSDPLRLALQAILLVGVAAALALAVIGFGLHFLVAAQLRLGEYAILRANGLSAGVVRRSLGVEQVVLLAHGLGSGAALGALVAFAVVPVLQLGSDPTDVVPPSAVTLDPAGALVAAAGLLGGGLLVGWLARLATARMDLVQQLRQLG